MHVHVFVFVIFYSLIVDFYSHINLFQENMAFKEKNMPDIDEKKIKKNDKKNKIICWAKKRKMKIQWAKRRQNDENNKYMLFGLLIVQRNAYLYMYLKTSYTTS